MSRATSAAASTPDLGWAWVDHLRAGGTTGWLDFASAAHSAAGSGERLAWFPGAQQLELLRHLNLTGEPSPELIHEVLTADLPLRGRLDLGLAGMDAHGVDPVGLPERELVRVAVGILARHAVRGGLSIEPAPARVARGIRWGWRRLRNRPVRLVGDPVLVGGLRSQVLTRGRTPLRGAQRVLVVGASVDRMLLDAWWHRVLQHGAPTWTAWQRGLLARDRLPASIDLARIAHRWSRVGEVQVVLDAAAVGHETGAGKLQFPTAPDPAVTELARLTGAVLGVAVPPDQRAALLRRSVLPRLLAQQQSPGAHPLLPEVTAWATAQQERLHQRLRQGGYPVVGEAAPIAAERRAGGGSELLRLAVRVLLDEETSPAQAATSVMGGGA